MLMTIRFECYRGSTRIWDSLSFFLAPSGIKRNLFACTELISHRGKYAIVMFYDSMGLF